MRRPTLIAWLSVPAADAAVVAQMNLRRRGDVLGASGAGVGKLERDGRL
jgi:hypothetical protein